ncbi:MAG: hypothetical protein KOO69_03090 [Victivallales bacterium]|nr:hypothetical protein [Victivallales bacterium]
MGSHKKDEGTAFIANVGTDITDATLVEIDVVKSDGTEDTWDGEIYNVQKIKHVIVDGDYSVKGTYKAQAQVTTPDGFWSGDETEFYVSRKLVDD